MNNNIGEKFLPVGTIVLLKDATKRLMITGFCITSVEDRTMYDYSGCLYPEGIISSDQTALFNHNQIDKIFHLGLVDEEEQNFKSKLKQMLASTKQNTNQSQVIKQQPQMTQPQPTQQQPTVVQPQPNLNTLNLNQQNNNQ